MDLKEMHRNQEIVPAFESPKFHGNIQTRRLNTLNDDCLLHIMSYLSVTEILQTCKSDSHFKDLAKLWIVGKKLVDVRYVEEATRNEILNGLGKSVKKLKLKDADLSNFLQTTIKKCEPGKITELHLQLAENPSTGWDSDAAQLDAAIHILSGLQQFTLHPAQRQQDGLYDSFINRILTSNLSMLKLINMDVQGYWMTGSDSLNLTELSIYDATIISKERLTQFIKRLPNLRKWIYVGDTNISFAARALQQHCPHLTTFYDICRPSASEPLVANAMRYVCIKDFVNLTTVGLTSYTFCGSDLFEAFKILSSKKKIVKLSVFTDFKYAREFDEEKRKDFLKRLWSVCDMVSLVEFEIDTVLCCTGGEEDLRGNFLLHFGSQLKNLKKFTLKTCNGLLRLNSILQMFPQIAVLSIANNAFFHLPVTMKHLALLLRKLRREGNQTHLMQLIVNTQQFQELNTSDDIQKLTDVKVASSTNRNLYTRLDDIC